MLWLRRIVATISYPVQIAWLNRHLDSSSRATVISMTGQANAVGQAVGGPALGWAGNVLSIQAALLGSVVLLSPVVALYARMTGRAQEVQEVSLTPADWAMRIGPANSWPGPPMANDVRPFGPGVTLISFSCVLPKR